MKRTSLNRNWQLAEIELVYRTGIARAVIPKVNSSEISYGIFLSIWDESKIELVEQVKMLLLNRAAKLIGIYELSSGGTSISCVDAKMVFSAALLANASGIILAHNHPSGNVEPSLADRQLTTKLHQAARLLDMELLDHLVISSEEYFSFADRGLLP